MDTQPSKGLVEIHNLTEKLTINKFRKILFYPMVNLIRETIDYTRSYEAGLDAWLRLLKFAEQNKLSLSEKERNEYFKTLYLSILHSLDCLDRWEEYLDVWEKIFSNTNISYTFSYSPPKSKEQINTGYYDDIEKYLISEAKTRHCVHFLYYQSNRKKIIERKLARKRAGGKIGNLLHARQEDLAKEEIKIRYERMLNKAQFVDHVELLIKKARHGS